MTAARATTLRSRRGCPTDRAGSGVGVALLLAVAVGLAVAPAPGHAAERIVTITPSGVVPSQLEVAPGDTVRFVSQDPTFAYQAESTGGAWSFDSGPTELLDGDYAVPAPLVQPGTYTYRVAQDEPFQGAVVVPGAAAPAHGPAAAPTPADGASAGDPPAPGGAEPSSTAAAATPPAAVPGASRTAAPVARAVPGDLPGADTHRSLGLPVALATLLVLGTASLLLRLVLAEAAVSDPPDSPRRHGGRTSRW